MLVQVYYITTIHHLSYITQALHQLFLMDPKLTKLLLMSGFLGISYCAFTWLTKRPQKLLLIPLGQAQKIGQEIKYQLLTAAVIFTTSINQSMGRGNKQKHSEKLTDYFTSKIVEIYQQKQRLVLDKHGLTTAHYQRALHHYSADEQIKQINNEITMIIEKCVQGEMPSLQVDKKATYAFGKLELAKIYQDMSKVVLHALAMKLKEIKQDNPNFDSRDTSQFKIAVRALNVFDMKIEYLTQKGFKKEWGSPNEIFYKLTETYKMKDGKFRQEMTALQQIYDKVIEQIAANPISFPLQSIDSYYLDKDFPRSRQALSKSEIGSGKMQKEQTFHLNKSSRSEPKQKENSDFQNELPDEAKVLNPNQIK